MTLKLLPLLIALLAPVVAAGEIRVSVSNTKGKPVAQAVVYARAIGLPMPAMAQQSAVIDQIDKEFVPELTVVYQGATISFPNNDNIRHHVYSFSKSNPFEIPLYANKQAEPISFTNPGVVALGCNVHDWMSAYVFVSDTPYYGVTGAEGQVTLAALPAGEYAVELWQAQLRGEPAEFRQTVSVTDAATELNFVIRQKRVWKAWRSSMDDEEDY